MKIFWLAAAIVVAMLLCLAVPLFDQGERARQQLHSKAVVDLVANEIVEHGDTVLLLQLPASVVERARPRALAIFQEHVTEVLDGVEAAPAVFWPEMRALYRYVVFSGSNVTSAGYSDGGAWAALPDQGRFNRLLKEYHRRNVADLIEGGIGSNERAGMALAYLDKDPNDFSLWRGDIPARDLDKLKELVAELP